MSIDSPKNNKMMTSAPAKKEYHFAATAEHLAHVVYAATIEEAEKIYHKVKRPIGTSPATSVAVTQEVVAPSAPSTAPIAPETSQGVE